MKKIKVSLFTKLILMVIIPLFLLGIALVLLGRNAIKDTVSREVISQLENTLKDLSNTMDVFDDGEYIVRDNLFFKGQSDIAYMNDYIRTVKSSTDIDITIFVKDTRYLTTIKNENGNIAAGTKADEAVCKVVLEKGGTYVSDRVPVNGELFFGVYMPVKNGEGNVIGMLFAGSPVSYVNQIVIEEAGNMTTVSVVMILIILFISFLIIYCIAGKLKNIIGYVMILSDGNFQFDMNEKDCRRRDEIGKLASGIRNLRDTLQNIISGIENSSEKLEEGAVELREMSTNYAGGTEQISKSIGELEESIVSMAENIQEADLVTEEMGKQIDCIAENMESLSAKIKSTQEAEKSSEEMMELLKETNKSTIRAAELIVEHVNQTDHSVRQISDAIGVLDEINSKVNLLSLNAGIEAARASGAGRGFAVIAEEIRKLAEQSSAGTKEIMDIMEHLFQASAVSTGEAGNMRETVLREKTALDTAEKAFFQLMEGVHAVEDSVAYTLEQTEHISGLKNQVIDSMCSLSTISEENAAIAEDVNNECQKMKEESVVLNQKSIQIRNQASDLEEQLCFFKKVKKSC